jgi:hypothetical protein
MVHCTNLAVQVLLKLNMVSKLETFSKLWSLYVYFCKSPKRHLEVSKLVEILETKGNKILKNVKIRWISMLALAKRVMAKYCTFGCQLYI